MASNASNTASNTNILGAWAEAPEAALLGALIYQPDHLPRILDRVRASDFWELKRQWLFEVMIEQYTTHKTFDNLTLCEGLRARVGPETYRNIGGDSFVTEMLNAVVYSANIEVLAALVNAASLRRDLLSAAGEFAELARTDSRPIQESLVLAQERLTGIAQRLFTAHTRSGTEVLREALIEFDYWFENPTDARGLRTNLASLDGILQGIGPGLISIGGATGMGKSTFAGYLVRTFAKAGLRGLYVPTETLPKIAFHKLAGDSVGMPYKHIRRGVPAEVYDKVAKAYLDLNKVAGNIVTMPGTSPDANAIRATALRMLNEKPGCHWVMIDSGSKLADGALGETDYIRVSRTVHALQDLSLQGIPVFVTWQFGRHGAESPGRIPRLHDFKNAGSVEEDSRICIALYRRDYYVARGLAEPDPKYPPNTVALFILKDSEGGTGDEMATVGFIPGKGIFDIHVETVKLNE